jgi:hypothetical protein
VQLNKMGDVGGSSPQQPGAPDSGGDNKDRERTGNGLWLSAIVESVTSFYSSARNPFF